MRGRLPETRPAAITKTPAGEADPACNVVSRRTRQGALERDVSFAESRRQFRRIVEQHLTLGGELLAASERFDSSVAMDETEHISHVTAQVPQRAFGANPPHKA